MATQTIDHPKTGDAGPQSYDYARAKNMAREGVWSVTLPDAPNIAPEEVVVVCVGPRPEDDRYDAYAMDAGGDGAGRWITLALFGKIEGEIDVLEATETTFLDNYRWTAASADPIPVPGTMATLIGIVSGARARGEAPLPTEAARTIVDAMTADSMKGHVQQTLPASRLLHWFASAQMVASAALAIAGLALIVYSGTYVHAVRIVCIGAVILASCGILVDTNYRRETSRILRLPEGYAEGREKVSKNLRLSCLITGFLGVVVLVGTSALA